MEEEREVGPLEFEGQVGQIIEKIPKVCRTFQKSSSLNYELQSMTEGGAVKLVLDVRTWWNSMLRMYRNFLKLEEPLRKFFSQDRKNKAFPLSNADLNVPKEVIKSLSHVEEAALRLSKKDCTMQDGDLVLQVNFHLALLSYQ